MAVAEEGSFKLAADKRLHTAQPSLSRQIRDLEHEVGTQLLRRSARGVELTEAGRAFLDHARLALAQAKSAVEVARRIGRPSKPVFAVGFLVGHEADCIPPTMDILRDDLPGLEVRIFSGFSVDLANDLLEGRLDVAFLRHEQIDDLDYRHVLSEPLVAIVPSDHRLAAGPFVDPRALADETFIGISPIPRVLRGVVNDYLERSGMRLAPRFEIDNFAMALSLVASTRGVRLAAGLDRGLSSERDRQSPAARRATDDRPDGRGQKGQRIAGPAQVPRTGRSPVGSRAAQSVGRARAVTAGPAIAHADQAAPADPALPGERDVAGRTVPPAGDDV